MQPADADDEPAPASPRLRRLLSKKFLVLSLLAHLLFAGGAAVWIVQVAHQKSPRTFQSLAPGPNAPSRALEHKVQMKQRRAMSAPVATKRAMTIPPARFVLPAMPLPPRQPTVAAASRLSGMGGNGNSLALAGAGAGAGFGNSGGALFMASIGGMKVQAKRLAVALDNSKSVARYQANVQSYVKRTFKDSEVATFSSASFKTPRGGNSIGSVLFEFLNSPKNFDSIYVFSDFETPAANQEEAWARLKPALAAKKVRLYLHVLQDYGRNQPMTPAVRDAMNFAKTTGGSVKIGPMLGM